MDLDTARHLFAASGHAVIPGREVGRATDPDGVLPDVVLAETPALFVMPVALLLDRSGLLLEHLCDGEHEEFLDRIRHDA